MKKYISTILIDALLIQLTGCYSWETVQTPQQNSTIKIITKDSTEIELPEWNWNETDKYFMYLPEKHQWAERDSTMKWMQVDKNEIITIQEKKFDDEIVIKILAGAAVLAIIIIYLIPFHNKKS